MARPVCVVVGVGPGNGGAIARRFGSSGYSLALLARSADFSRELAATLPEARPYACDASDPVSIERTFATLRSELGEVDVLVWNAGSGVFKDVESTTPSDLEAAFRVNALGALVGAQQVIPAMRSRGRGAIVFIGATASRRGGAKTAPFAAAKAAQRSLAESMARSLWPAGIHVALVIIDGVVDLPRTRAMMPNAADDFFVKPDGVADTVFHLVGQDRSAWSFEVEARPFAEKW